MHSMHARAVSAHATRDVLASYNFATSSWGGSRPRLARWDPTSARARIYHRGLKHACVRQRRAVRRIASVRGRKRGRAEIVDPHGRVIDRVSTGGVISPTRHEIAPATSCSASAGPACQRRRSRWAPGGWKASFEEGAVFRDDTRYLPSAWRRAYCAWCRPNWSNLGTLIRATARRPLLAYRGLGNSVVVPKGRRFRRCRLPHQNEIAARRVHQHCSSRPRPRHDRRRAKLGDGPQGRDAGFIYL